MTCLAAQQDMSRGTEGAHATGEQEHGGCPTFSLYAYAGLKVIVPAF
jgi:hypothetical protein